MSPTCTCLPLNRRLMAHLLKVDEGSVHEADCWDRAVSEAVTRVLDALAGEIAGLTAVDRRAGGTFYRCDDEGHDHECPLAAVLALIDEHRPKGDL